MKSIFEKDSYNELLVRLGKLTEVSEPTWGKMNSSQMVVHCRKAIELAMGDVIIETKHHPLVLYIARFFKKSLYDAKPFKKSLPTIKDFVIEDYDDFNVEIKRLKDIMHRMHTHEKFFFPYTAHPVFGRLEVHMWGQSAYKHLDHHFKQFGV